MPGISLSNFFKEKRNASEIKSEILNAYFKAWAAILLKGQQFKEINHLLYVDLFSGPGLYDDGKPSTPIKILNSIYESKGSSIDFDRSVVTIFNDKTSSIVRKLKKNIEGLHYYNDLRNKPILANEPASEEILERLLKSGHPSLTFIDPLGYGYTQKMLLHSVKSWGSDLFMLFNFNRIRAAIKNKLVQRNMLQIFTDKFEEIQNYYKKESAPYKREQFIIRMFEEIFKEEGYLILRFRVNFPNRNQTSHYLFFISKHQLAITRAKEIMTKYSDAQPDGVPLFGANLVQSPMFFPTQCEYSIVNLKEIISDNRIKYNSKTIEEIYRFHNYGTNYIKHNYKEAISQLLQENLITLENIKGEITDRITYTAKVKFK